MKIVCVGRNYAAHARELENEVPEEPVLFMKPDTALLPAEADLYLPEHSQDLHYEVELVVKIGKPGRFIDAAFAQEYYQSVTVGIDFTARDTQRALKAKGLPWEKAKAFDGSAYVGQWLAVGDLPEWPIVEFGLQRNGEWVQKTSSSAMLHGVDALISHASRYFTFKTGDLLFTGTPAGVGPVKSGDQLEVYLNDRALGLLRVK